MKYIWKQKHQSERHLKNKKEHPIANKLLKAKGDCEISYFWHDEKTGVLLKARPDKVVDDIIIDVKTTVSANPNVFYKKAYDYGYHKQL